MNQNVNIKYDLILKKNHYYFLRDLSYNEAHNAKYIPSRVIENINDEKVTLLNLESNENYVIYDRQYNSRKDLWLNEDLANNLGFTFKTSYLYHNGEKYSIRSFENQDNYFIHVINNFNNEIQAESGFMNKWIFIKKDNFEIAKNFNYLFEKGLTFTHIEDLFKILYGEEYYLITDKFIRNFKINQYSP